MSNGFGECAECGCPVERPGWDNLCVRCVDEANEELEDAPPRPPAGAGRGGGRVNQREFLVTAPQRLRNRTMTRTEWLIWRRLVRAISTWAKAAS